MSREPEPGDVALVRNRFGVWNRAICTVGADGDTWRFGVALSEQPVKGSEAHPLIVIDPSDSEQIERFAIAYEATWSGGASSSEGTVGIIARQMTAALRSLITPPRPPEPTGLGAVVEDEKGKRYIRTADTDCTKPWSYANNYSDHAWDDITAVTVLSEGVQS